MFNLIKDFSIIRILKYFIISTMILFVLVGGWLGMSILSVIEQTPQIDASDINSLMAQTSEILDSNGNLIEKIQTREYRNVVSMDVIPKKLSDAFISVEDERFEKHRGVDPIGIASAMVDNLTKGHIVRGASTIAQQLARNLYLTDEKSYIRKIQEAYIALQLTEQLGREKVLEAYMNTVFLGQNAYGVQAAAETYFSKDVSELTIAESAAIAGIVKSPTNLALYRTYLPTDVEDESKIIGDIVFDNNIYKAVWNQQAIDRQHYVLAKMLENERITEAEYQAALSEDIVAHLQPGVKNLDNLSSYYSTLVQKQVVEKLVSELGYSEDKAREKLVTGGLKIYAVVDASLQQELEELYNNFSDILFGRYGKYRPAMLNWSADKSSNITNSLNQVIYFKKDFILTENNEVLIPKSLFTINEDGSLLFHASNSQRVRKVGNYLDVVDYYTVNEENSLITHKISPIALGENAMTSDENGNIRISAEVLQNNPDLYLLTESGDMILSANYYTIDETGIKQPQSSAVVIENETGYIKALVGGREQEKSGIINRASNVPRQPGSSIKPIAVYTPALDNGYTTASGIDDVPFYNSQGELWPSNWYKGYKGMVSLRESVEQSINVSAVKVLNDVGIPKSKEYLEKFGLVNPSSPSKDNFITAAENGMTNDENLAAMALGAMTRGLTNLDLTGAFSALANHGEYIEPITFTKVIDANDDVILENPQVKNKVVSEQVAYVMTDVLKSSTNHMYSTNARKEGFDVAGKTGTTQENTDLWFVGYTPYYTIGTWIGFDNQQLKLARNSGEAVELWAKINDIVLKDKEPKRFDEPEGIVHMAACTISNSLPKKACYSDNKVKEEVFVKGTEPTEYCEVHFSRQINVIDNLLATNKTPESELGYKTFIKRPIPYKPSENNWIYPDDWYKTLPGYSPRTEADLVDEDEEDDDTNNNNSDNGDNNNSNTNNNSTNQRTNRTNRDED